MKAIKNTIEFSAILKSNKNYKEQSIFRIIDFLNKKDQEYLRTAAGVKKIDLDFLKTISPDYFLESITKTVKKVKTTTTEPRKLFSPFTFMVDIRKKYGII
jgi:hypothetical protein